MQQGLDLLIMLGLHAAAIVSVLQHLGHGAGKLGIPAVSITRPNLKIYLHMHLWTCSYASASTSAPVTRARPVRAHQVVGGKAACSWDMGYVKINKANPLAIASHIGMAEISKCHLVTKRDMCMYA